MRNLIAARDTTKATRQPTPSTASSIVTGGYVGVDLMLLAAMVVCGILGGIVGRKVNSKIDDKTVDKLFMGLMVLIILINAYNIWKFALA